MIILNALRLNIPTIFKNPICWGLFRTGPLGRSTAFLFLSYELETIIMGNWGRFPRVFGDEFGDKFGEKYGDSLNSVKTLVTNLVTKLVNHQIWWRFWWQILWQI